MAPSLPLQVAGVMSKVAEIMGLASCIIMVTAALQGSEALRLTLMIRSKLGAAPAGMPVIWLPAVKLVHVMPSKDHCNKFPVSAATFKVTLPVAVLAQTG